MLLYPLGHQKKMAYTGDPGNQLGSLVASFVQATYLKKGLWVSQDTLSQIVDAPSRADALTLGSRGERALRDRTRSISRVVHTVHARPRLG